MRKTSAVAVLVTLALGVVASACSNSPSPSASQSTTTTSSSTQATSATSTTESTGSSSTTTSTSAAGPQPTLGLASAWGASAQGFGQVKPAEISLGGDPTGVLTGITWQSWGGAVATGTGTSTFVGPNQSVAQGTMESATVVASNLGTCHGAPAYQQVKWYFPGQGETLSTGANTTINACTGP